MGKWFEKKWFAYTIAMCSAVLLYVILTHLPMVWKVVKTIYGFISPIFIGFVIAYILDPVTNFFEKKCFGRMSRRRPLLARSIAVFLTVAAVIAAVCGFITILAVPIVQSIITIIQNMSGYLADLNALLNDLNSYAFLQNVDLSGIISSLSGLGQALMNVLSENIQTIIDTSVKVGSGAVMLFIEFVIAIYLLLDKRNLQSAAKRILRLIMRDRTYDAVKTYVLRCSPIIYRFIGCDLLDALIVGIANAIFMTIAGIPNIALISLIVGVCNLAPTFGPFVGAFVGSVILLLINPWQALIFLIFTLILQLIDGYIIKPKMFGNIMDVSAVWILICIIVLGRMFGILGVLLSIPFAAISNFTYSDYIIPALQKRHDRRAAEEPKEE